MKRRYGQTGFSLIELMVAVAVLGVLLSLGMPSLLEWIRNVKVRNAAEGIHAGIQLARMEAMRRNIPTTFWLVSANASNSLDNSCATSSTSSSWVVSQDDPAGLCATEPSQTTTPRIVQAQAGSTRVSITTIPVGGTSITFNGLGQLAGANNLSQIDVTSADDAANTRSLRITISSGGSTRSCDPNLPTGSTDPRKC